MARYALRVAEWAVIEPAPPTDIRGVERGDDRSNRPSCGPVEASTRLPTSTASRPAGTHRVPRHPAQAVSTRPNLHPETS
jgi:hypothetical protein